jgi:hypothetical protein
LQADPMRSARTPLAVEIETPRLFSVELERKPPGSDPEGADAAARRRCHFLLTQFHDYLTLDRHDARRRIRALRLPASLVPPAPRTPRGLVGRLLVRLQTRLLWWIPRSFRLRDRALESLWQSFEEYAVHRGAVQRQLESRLAAVEWRLAVLDKEER